MKWREGQEGGNDKIGRRDRRDGTKRWRNKKGQKGKEEEAEGRERARSLSQAFPL